VTSPSDLAERAAAARLQTAFELFEWGVDIKRAALRRERPEASPDEIERAIERWLLTRPGAEAGDAEGIPGEWPRRPTDR